MGAIAEGLVAYAQPLLDETDGSEEQLNKAFMISQLCFNLALLPEDGRHTAFSEMQSALKMDDEKFDAFRSSIVAPMIQRHQEMFPLMHRRIATSPSQTRPLLQSHPRTVVPAETYSEVDRYAPCPCNSGKKYKFCCGAKGR